MAERWKTETKKIFETSFEQMAMKVCAPTDAISPTKWHFLLNRITFGPVVRSNSCLCYWFRFNLSPPADAADAADAAGAP